ncbi:hypothetical protein, partial [Pseudomonas helleri]|uniref:hypothetical protein n=1 Tax=Pseudomonas helleri TaxID=1608996 RepID=UPI001E47D4E4
FGIRHRGSTVPERSGVALSFCRRPFLNALAKPIEAQRIIDQYPTFFTATFINGDGKTYEQSIVDFSTIHEQF